MDDIHIQEAHGPAVGEMEVEIVERKGIGHPDTICDSIMEQVSQALSRAYREHFGAILHHNCDKGLLVAGQVERRFGGGRVIEPMGLVIGDRATSRVGAKSLDVKAIAIETARTWFRDHIQCIDPDRHMQYRVELKPGSEELTSLFWQPDGVLGANDTSAAVGYAPLSETERLVLETEQYLNTSEFKARFPQTGEDVKVMGVRNRTQLDLTVAMPILDRYVENEADYFRHKEAVHADLSAFLRNRLEQITHVKLSLNHLDHRGKGMGGMYLSVLGTSAEDADSGEVGRGNQVNGLIALNRPRGSEAAAGKNPVSHVGKIYNVLSSLLAKRLHAEILEIREAVVWMCSRIGDPIDRPQMVSVQVRLEPSATTEQVAGPVRRIVSEELARISGFCKELAEGRYSVC